MTTLRAYNYIVDTSTLLKMCMIFEHIKLRGRVLDRRSGTRHRIAYAYLNHDIDLSS